MGLEKSRPIRPRMRPVQVLLSSGRDSRSAGDVFRNCRISGLSRITGADRKRLLKVGSAIGLKHQRAVEDMAVLIAMLPSRVIEIGFLQLHPLAAQPADSAVPNPQKAF